jgi:hypothetical protein
LRRQSGSKAVPHWSGLRFYARLVMYPFRKFPPYHAVCLIGAFFLAQIANVVGFAHASRRISQSKIA